MVEKYYMTPSHMWNFTKIVEILGNKAAANDWLHERGYPLLKPEPVNNYKEKELSPVGKLDLADIVGMFKEKESVAADGDAVKRRLYRDLAKKYGMKEYVIRKMLEEFGGLSNYFIDLDSPSEAWKEELKKWAYKREASIRGAHSRRPKLTKAQATDIRRRYRKGGSSMAALAREYGVTTPIVSSIIHNKTYKE